MANIYKMMSKKRVFQQPYLMRLAGTAGVEILGGSGKTVAETVNPALGKLIVILLNGEQVEGWLD